MEAEHRSALLASLRSQDPHLADQLEALLHEHQLLSREKFLEDAAGAMPRPTGLAGQVLGAFPVGEIEGEERLGVSAICP